MWGGGLLRLPLAMLSPVRVPRLQFTGSWLGPMADMDECGEE